MKKTSLIALIGLVIMSSSCGKTHSTQETAYDFAPLDSIISGWMAEGFYPGGAICVVKDSTVVFHKNYGEVTDTTPFHVASAGKWVAAATIAAVVERTPLEWTDTVAAWLPEYASDPKGSISLERLLSHTSGVRPYLPAPRVDNYNHLDSAVAEILPLDTVFAPGKRFEYGGLAMQIAGRMAEKATGMEYEQIFQSLIAEPLGMTASHFTPVNTDGGHAPMLAGGLTTTLHDYMHFLEMIAGRGIFRGKQILSGTTIDYMQADHVGDAAVPPGEYVERGVGQTHNGVYGLGEWREYLGANGKAYRISSPGWAGAYPWIDTNDGVYGFFITHVTGPMDRPEKNFNSFFGSPIISSTVATTVNNEK